MSQEAGARGQRISVAVAGASGRMGREVVQAVLGAPDLLLAGAVSGRFGGPDGAGPTALEVELGSRGIATFRELDRCLVEARPDVLVEFTSAAVAPANLRAAVEAGVRPVSGTTGIPADELEALASLVGSHGLGAVVVPNFSLGATVLAILGRTAAPYFRAAEIIEMHHDQKRDAPSGTALVLARIVGSSLKPEETTGLPTNGPAPADPTPGPRGVLVGGVPIHSVRLSGLVAHHELIFASSGETLTLRHDSVSRASFMPGVLLAVRSVSRLSGLITSLEELLRLTAR